MTRLSPLIPTIAGIILPLIAWFLLAAQLGNRHLLAAPQEVITWIMSHPDLIGRGLAITARNAALGFLAGNLVAVLLAAIALIWPRLQSLITGLALVVFCLPLIATGPILRVLMGPGEGPQITLAALAVYYTTLIPLLTGLRAVPASWLDLVRSQGRGAWAELVHIRARAALPYLFAGLQIAAPAAFLGAMVGEFTGAERGLGVLTIRFMRGLDAPALWSIALLAAASSMAVYAAIGWLAKAILHEHPPLILAPAPGLGITRWCDRVIAIAALILTILVIWWGMMAALQLNPFFAKRPLHLATALISGPDAAQMRASLMTALQQTAIYLLPGYLAGLILGAGLAILLTLAPGLSALVMPVAIALRAIPIITTAPLIVLFLGRGGLGTIALVAIMVFFPTLVACLQGLRQAPGQILDLFDSYAAGRARKIWHIRLPAMLPAFCAAARMGVPAAILAVTVVEWLTTGRGLGSLMALSASVSDYDMLWAAVVIVTTVSAVGYGLIAAVERRILTIFAPEQVHA